MQLIFPLQVANRKPQPAPSILPSSLQNHSALLPPQLAQPALVDATLQLPQPATPVTFICGTMRWSAKPHQLPEGELVVSELAAGACESRAHSR